MDAPPRQIPWIPGFPSEYIAVGVRLHHVVHYPMINNKPCPSHLYVAIPWNTALVDNVTQLKDFTLQQIRPFLAEDPVSEEYKLSDIFGRAVPGENTQIDMWGNLPPQAARSHIPELAVEYLAGTKLEFTGAHHMTPVVLHRIDQDDQQRQ